MSFAAASVVLSLIGCVDSASFGPRSLEPPQPAQRILDPGCGGSQYSTIQSAIAAALDDDIVEVCSGTYHERLTISGKRLTLRTSGGTVTVDADSQGKALSITTGATVTVDGITFLEGHTSGSGAGVYCSASTLTLIHSTLVSGSTSSNGGGLGASGCTGSVSDTTFEDNSARNGGGVWVSGDDFVVRDNTFTSNYADHAGGGVYIDGDSDILDNTISSNDAHSYGGGAYVSYGNGDVRGNDVSDNTSGNDGGGVYVHYGAPRIEANTFDGNESDDDGGGLRMKSSTGTVVDNLMTHNHADAKGGGCKVSHAEATLSGNTYIDNTAGGGGGAIVLEESSSHLTNETYTGNSSDDGGAMYVVDGWGSVVLEDCTFSGNEADHKGGAIYLSLPGRTLKLRRVDIRDGSAELGGGLYAIGSDVEIVTTVFQDDSASISGGAMYLDSTSGKVTNSLTYATTAPAGSALAVVNGVGLTVTNTVFRKATTSAAVALVGGVPPMVRYSDFSGNTGDFSGMASVVGTVGNISSKPDFVSSSASNFQLLAGSPLIDAGDQAIQDLDGTRSDMGVYGGPESR